MMVVTGITSLYSVRIVSVFLGLSLTFALFVWYPEIKRLVSPKERQIQRGKAKLERAQEAADHDKHKFCQGRCENVPAGCRRSAIMSA